MRIPPFIFLLACLFSLWVSRGQEVVPGPGAQFSAITCGPGTDLYAIFGHSAFRYRDPSRGIDWVYNYGTFDFDTPNFYVKFARGKLPYALGKQQFENFLYAYQLENRYVREQLLDLDTTEIQALLTYLEENNRPENRVYKYDFLFENCATKVPDVLQAVLGPPLQYSYEHLAKTRSFRDLIQENLYWNTWSSFGIDLALGAVIDREAEGGEFSFLPKYVEQQIENATLGEAPLVVRRRVILDLNPGNTASFFTATPLFWMLFLLGLTLVITWIDYRNKTRSRVLDFLLFFVTGAAGFVLLFLWFFTDHTATAWNGNLLWAFPVNLALAFRLGFGNPTPQKLSPYLKFLIFALVVAGVLWGTGIQVFSPICLPIWTALLVRYLFLIRHNPWQP
jgi:hypothetical protein